MLAAPSDAVLSAVRLLLAATSAVRVVEGLQHCFKPEKAESRMPRLQAERLCTPLNDRSDHCAQVEEPKAEPRVEPKPDPTGKHMYATKVRPRVQSDYWALCLDCAVTAHEHLEEDESRPQHDGA